MATLQTYQSTGNREDLLNVITNISPEKTPFLSSLGKSKAAATNHEWLTDTLAAPADNAAVEGADITHGTLSSRTRLGNYVQNFQKEGKVSDIQEAVSKAGLTSEYQYQIMKASKEMGRDMERALWEGVKTVGTASVAPRMGGVYSFALTNSTSAATSTVTGTCTGAGTSTTINVAGGHGSAAGDDIITTGGLGAGQLRTIISVSTNELTVAAYDVVSDGTTTYEIYITPLSLTLDMLNNGLQTAADAGGEPDTIYVDGEMKRAISGLSTSGRRSSMSEKTLTEAVDVVDTDFGTQAVKYDRWAPTGTVNCIDSATWKLASLMAVKPEELPRLGTARRFMINAHVTLEALAENANAIVYGGKN